MQTDNNAPRFQCEIILTGSAFFETCEKCGGTGETGTGPRTAAVCEDCDGSGERFAPWREISRILTLHGSAFRGWTCGTVPVFLQIRDVNGNGCGAFYFDAGTAADGGDNVAP